MLRQAENIYEEVKGDISVGPSNIRKNINEPESEFLYRNDIIEFYRDIRDAIAKELSSVIINKDLILFQIFISALLAELYHSGNCGEYSHSALVKFIVRGIESNIELVRVLDYQTNSKHTFLLLNRDLKTDINNIKLWKEVILFDAWPARSKVKYFKDSSILENDLLDINPLINPSLIIKGAMVKHIDSIETIFQINENFTSAMWEKMSTFLKSAASVLDEKMASQFLKKNNLSRKFDAKTEAIKIQKCFLKASENYLVLSTKNKTVNIEKDLKISESTIFNESLKKNICNRLKIITGYEWMYYAANKSRKAEARCISAEKSDIINIVNFFMAANIKCALKKVSQQTPPQYVAQFTDVTSEKLSKLEEANMLKVSQNRVDTTLSAGSTS